MVKNNMHKKACILVDKFKYKNEVYENYFNYIITFIKVEYISKKSVTLHNYIDLV